MRTTKQLDDGAANPPLFLQVEASARCNLRCGMCAGTVRDQLRGKTGPGLMDMALFRKIIDGCPEARELHLQGLGEPLLHPEFFEMVGYGAARGKEVTTNSNMTVLTHAQAEQCVSSGLSWIRVSIDGASPAVYESIRTGSRLGQVLQNVQLLRLLRARAESVSPRLFLVMVLMKSNLHELKDIVSLADAYGLEHVFVQHLCYDFSGEGLPPRYGGLRDFFRAESLLGVDAAVLQREFSAARAAAGRLNIGLRLPALDRAEAAPGRPGTCNWTRRGLYVTHDGLAMPCCMIGDPERINFGDVAEDGVAEIWNNEAFRDFRLRLDSGQPPEVCRSCSVYRGIF